MSNAEICYSVLQHSQKVELPPGAEFLVWLPNFQGRKWVPRPPEVTPSNFIYSKDSFNYNKHTWVPFVIQRNAPEGMVLSIRIHEARTDNLGHWVGFFTLLVKVTRGGTGTPVAGDICTPVTFMTQEQYLRAAAGQQGPPPGQ